MTAILEKLTLYWTYPFVRYALVVGVLIALCSSLLAFPCGVWCNGDCRRAANHK